MWAYAGTEKTGSLESEWVVRGLWVGSYGGGGDATAKGSLQAEDGVVGEGGAHGLGRCVGCSGEVRPRGVWWSVGRLFGSVGR